MSEKGKNTSKHKTKDQPSPGDLKEHLTDMYATCREEIAEVAIAVIQPCPIIPDYKTPTLSTQPIVVMTPEACFCIDGWQYIEQGKADGRSTIRCHIYHIAHHSIIELAIRKAAIRVMPQGGKCLYAEEVRNTSQLYRNLQSTSDDLVLFTHGGDRRGVGFTDSKASNVRVVLASRLGKSPTTINKYLQHGEGLNDAAMEELVNSGATKTFFEAIQTKKQIAITILQSEQKDPATMAETISKEVMQWLSDSQEPEPPPATEQEREQAQQALRSASRERHTPNGNRGAVPTPSPPRNGSDENQDPPASDLTPTDETTPAVELKRIGEALIEIADGQESPTPQQIESIRTLIVELSALLSRIATPTRPEIDRHGRAD